MLPTLPRHGNYVGGVHGGAILTFADYALCLVAGRAADGGTNTSFAMTVSIAVEFLDEIGQPRAFGMYRCAGAGQVANLLMGNNIGRQIGRELLGEAAGQHRGGFGAGPHALDDPRAQPTERQAAGQREEARRADAGHPGADGAGGIGRRALSPHAAPR